MPSRREFLVNATVAGAGALLAGEVPLRASTLVATPPGVSPVAIASGNGKRAVDKAIEIIRTGADALDGVIAGVNIIESDPDDMTVGYGGLPNEEGVVELDAAVMHGPTHNAGAVAALRNIKNPSSVARLVMERTDHVLLVGEGALRFARAHGFQEENLLTDRAREVWLKWKESHSTIDNWLPAHTDTTRGIGLLDERSRRDLLSYVRHMGTVHCSAIDLKGNISCTTSTSGLSFKLPGRVGDSPIIGAGLYVDNAVGAAGSTGRGESNIVNCSCVMIVEYMRQGSTPEEACFKACTRIVDNLKMARLKNDQGHPEFNVSFYALSRSGAAGGACIRQGGGSMAVHDGTSSRILELPYLFKR